MKLPLPATLLACCACFAWASRSAGSRDLPAGSDPADLHGSSTGAGSGALDAPVPGDGRRAAPTDPSPVDAPVTAASGAAASDAVPFEVPAVPLVLAAEETGLPPIPSSAAEGVARRYFHALVQLEELQASLPPEDEAHPRTVERYPGLFAANEERTRRYADLQRVEGPRAFEPLPALDLEARDGDFERIFGTLAREDRLVEQWRITRFAYAESTRLLEAQLEAGNFSGEKLQPALAWG